MHSVKKIVLFFVLLSTILLAEPIYSFKIVGINYIDWSSDTESKTSNRDFSSIKFDGGFGYDWTDFYGYIALENPTDSYSNEAPHNQRYAAFGDWDIALKDDYKIHIQNFYANSNNYYVNDFVVGFGYKYYNDGFLDKTIFRCSFY